jgi:[protein-PII] uridylyltransferase
LEFPTGIAIDNKAHPAYTLVQIETPDRIGLLYDLLTGLGQEGVNIGLSRISTQKGAAIDTFYINDATTGGKITDSNRIAGVQRRLRAVILSGAAR